MVWWLLASRVVSPSMLSLNLQMLQSETIGKTDFSVLTPKECSPHRSLSMFGLFPHLWRIVLFLHRYGSLTRLIKDGFPWQNYHFPRTRVIRFMPSLGHQILAGKICIILETFQLHLLVLPPCIALLPTSVVINLALFYYEVKELEMWFVTCKYEFLVDHMRSSPSQLTRELQYGT